MNEFNQCLSCASGYKLSDGHCVPGTQPNPPAPSGGKKCQARSGEGWSCGDYCVRVTSGGNLVTCDRCQDWLNSNG